MPVIRLFGICTVMQFNIEEGGTLVSLPQIIHVIQAVNPDIVCIEEADGNIPLIAEKLGWPYFDIRQQILSRFPIIDPPNGNGIYIYVEMSPGKYIAVSNVHLPSHKYGPALLKKGKPLSWIFHVERRLRLAPLKKYLEVLPALAARGIPVILAGDFNSLSYLDGIRETYHQGGIHEYAFLSVCEWPVSLEVANAGFRDSYREVHPHPHAKPGFTWWADRPLVPGWNPTPEELHDRIDFIYVMGPAKTIDSQVIGPCCADSSFSPWPSDHCALISAFDLAPSNEPMFVSVNKRLISTGEPLLVAYNTRQIPGQKIVIVRSNKQSEILAAHQINGQFHATLQFSTESWLGHTYEAQLLDNSGAVLSRTTFFVKPPEEKTTVSVKKSVFAYKEPIVVRWRNGPGNRWDWIGIFSMDNDSKEAEMWFYTDTEIDGRYKFNSKKQISRPLPPGRYKACYFIDETYKEIARVQFRVE